MTYQFGIRALFLVVSYSICMSAVKGGTDDESGRDPVIGIATSQDVPKGDIQGPIPLKSLIYPGRAELLGIHPAQYQADVPACSMIVGRTSAAQEWRYPRF